MTEFACLSLSAAQARCAAMAQELSRFRAGALLARDKERERRDSDALAESQLQAQNVRAVATQHAEAQVARVRADLGKQFEDKLARARSSIVSEFNAKLQALAVENSRLRDQVSQALELIALTIVASA